MTLAYFALLAERADREWTWRHEGVEASYDQTSISGAPAAAVAFRGTEFDFRDILADMRALPWWDNRLGWCHAGFLKTTRALWEETTISDTLLKLEMPLYLTGHSLGGARATILAAMLAAMGRPPAGLITFGSPRVGFTRLGRVLNCVSVQRYVNGNDIVPTVPPLLPLPEWLHHWQHVGAKTDIASEGLHPGDPFENHRVADYAAALARRPARPGAAHGGGTAF